MRREAKVAAPPLAASAAAPKSTVTKSSPAPPPAAPSQLLSQADPCTRLQTCLRPQLSPPLRRRQRRRPPAPPSGSRLFWTSPAAWAARWRASRRRLGSWCTWRPRCLAWTCRLRWSPTQKMPRPASPRWLSLRAAAARRRHTPTSPHCGSASPPRRPRSTPAAATGLKT